MKYSDCHVTHHVLSNAADDKGITLPRKLVKQLAAEITYLKQEVDRPVTIPRRVMTLRELHDMHVVRRSLARAVSRWPECATEGIRVFRAAGWVWSRENSISVLRMCDKPWRITKEMWWQDRQELGFDDEEEPMKEPARGWWETPPVEGNDTAVPQREFGQLINLITAVIDKPLTSWQRKQLDRWEDAIHRSPPPFDPVLKVGVNEETREKAHQIERIKDACSATTIAATNMYDRGVRIIEQE